MTCEPEGDGFGSLLPGARVFCLELYPQIFMFVCFQWIVAVHRTLMWTRKRSLAQLPAAIPHTLCWHRVFPSGLRVI